MRRLSFFGTPVAVFISAKASGIRAVSPRSAPCRAIGRGRLLPDPLLARHFLLVPSLPPIPRAGSAFRRAVRGLVQGVQGLVQGVQEQVCAQCARTMLLNPAG